MKVKTVRGLLLVTIFIIVVMATYYALLPHDFLAPHVHKHREHSHFLQISSSLLSSQQSQIEETRFSNRRSEMSGWAVASKPAKNVTEVVMANTTASLEVAKEIYRKKGVVLFTMINDAFFDFAASWCCNIVLFGDIHQHVLFLTTDIQTGQRLRFLWPNVSVVVMNSPEFKGSQEYSKAGYVRMMVERTRYILRLLEAGIQILLFEVDCVWLTNPLPQVLARQADGDILATRVTGKDVTAGGFLLLNPTKATVRFWQQLTHLMDDLFNKIKSSGKSAAVSEALNDQEFFSNLARKKYAGIKITYLPSKIFPDGKWYNLPEKQRLESRPVLINNNWIVGIDTKRQRAKAFGHWFWEQSERKCNSTALYNLHH